MIPILLILVLSYSATTHHAAAQGFCVADLKGARSPAGFNCKSPASVDDFVLSGFTPGNASDLFKFSFTPAFVPQLPGLNGLGFSAARLDMEPGGAVPMHTHPDASEMLIMEQGQITAGFVSADNSVFVRTLGKGDVMVFPQGLVHFEVNAGKGKAAAILVFSSSNPSAQLLDVALFGNSLDSALVRKTMFLGPAQVMKLKRLFGGTG